MTGAERQKRYRERHREKVLLRNREMLRAQRRADPDRFRAYAKKWEVENSDKRADIEARRRERYATDPLRRARAVASATRWAKANPDKKKAIETAWRAANKERVAELARVTNKRYRDRNPHVLREIEAHRQRAKQATPAWGDKPKMRMVYRKAREFGFEVDHVVPLKHPLVCGLHVWQNLQLLDRNLNRAKNNRAWPDMP